MLNDATNIGLLLIEAIEPDNVALRLDTSYTYDAIATLLDARNYSEELKPAVANIPVEPVLEAVAKAVSI